MLYCSESCYAIGKFNCSVCIYELYRDFEDCQISMNQHLPLRDEEKKFQLLRLLYNTHKYKFNNLYSHHHYYYHYRLVTVQINLLVLHILLLKIPGVMIGEKVDL